MEEISQNPWFLGFLGWFAYNIIIFSTDKDIADEENRRFPIIVYVRKQWDNWLSTAILTFVWIIAGAEIVGASGHGTWSNIMYLASPIFFQKIYGLLKTLRKNKKDNTKY